MECIKVFLVYSTQRTTNKRTLLGMKKDQFPLLKYKQKQLNALKRTPS